MIKNPLFNNLDDTLGFVWNALVEAVANRHSFFHTPTIATIGDDHALQLRTVVLREADPQKWMLRFNTDRRSNKFAELSALPQIGVHVYDLNQKLQVRMSGQASLHIDDDMMQAAWQSSQKMSQLCYGTMPAPGSVISEADQFTMPGPADDVSDAIANFCTVQVYIDKIETLYLKSTGHKRARFIKNPDLLPCTSQWLVP